MAHQVAGRALLVEENKPFLGVDAQISHLIQWNCFDYLDHPPARVNTEDVPTPYAKGLEYAYLPNKERIIAAVKKVVG